jgi:hypothetical protein
MAGREFVIQELNTIGGSPPPGGTFERFVWTAKNHNIPFSPWSFGLTQRTVRTDYPGADDPTEQVLGPNYDSFTLQGVWDDRYNAPALNPQNAEDRAIINQAGNLFGGRPGAARKARDKQGGYAIREWRRMEALVRRGNQVRITFEEITIQGLITDLEISYRRSWDIGYAFTFSPHHRQPGGRFALSRSPRSVLNSKQLRNEVSDEVDVALAFHARAPRPRIKGTLYPDVDAQVDAWSANLLVIDDAIEQRNLSLDTEPGGGLLRLAANFFTMATISVTLIDELEALDSAEAMDFEAGVDVLDYDVWARGLQDQARRILVAAERAASELVQRAEPNSLALYQPDAGESLYNVSNRFYGTPHNWRTIASRNGLDSLLLAGTEILIIPEVTQR